MSDKVQIKISDILRMLKEGYTRKALATHYGVNASQMKRIFQHPELKGKRTMPKVEENYILIDDVTPTDEVETSSAEGTDEAIPVPEPTVETIEEADPWATLV